MKKILVVGFGAMGCRHVQSLLNHKDEYEIHVVEPSADNIRVNTERIGATPKDIIWHNGIDELSDEFDLAIVATSSGPRYTIVQQLLEKDVKLFLLEKIVFQSAFQFNDIIRKMKDAGAKGYCNFVNRYFSAYNEIKDAMKGASSPCTMIVHGGAFGLGCNAIHYIDIFQYIVGKQRLELNDSRLKLSDAENRRGKEYREFTGMMDISDAVGNRLLLVSESDFTGGVSISIASGNQQYLLSEQTQQMYSATDQGTSVKDFVILPTSKLTATITRDILSNNCRLTQVEETAPAHMLLFNSFNEIVHQSTDEKSLCPIT